MPELNHPFARALAVTLTALMAGFLATPAVAQDGTAPPGCQVHSFVRDGLPVYEVVCTVEGTEENSTTEASVSSLKDVEYVYRVGFLYEDDQRCWRVVAVVIEKGAEHSYYESYRRLANEAERLYDKDRTPRCHSDPFIDEPSPEQQAAQAWEHLAEGLSPTVVSQPADESVVGLPTFVIVEDYQPDADIDSDPRTITWDFGAFQLRATSTHMVEWDDHDPDNEFAHEPAWRPTNGREYLEGDENGPVSWEDGQPHYQGAVQPLAHIYQESDDRSITVNARWQAQWRLPGNPWTPLAVDDLYTQSTLDVAIHEYQAVVTD